MSTCYVPHQANQRIIDHAVARLGIDPARVFGNLDRYGNTSAASIPLALAEARDAGVLTARHAGHDGGIRGRTDMGGLSCEV